MPYFPGSDGCREQASGAFDPVTAADRHAEAAMRRMIGAAYPDHGIVGEEYGSERADADFVWVLDPIDGTRAFITGLPVWGTLIGLLHHGPSDPRHDGAALHRRALCRRRHARLVSRSGRRPVDRDPLLRRWRGRAVHHQPLSVFRRRRARLSSGSSSRSGSPAMASTATPIAWSAPARPTSSSRPGSRATTSSR